MLATAQAKAKATMVVRKAGHVPIEMHNPVESNLRDYVEANRLLCTEVTQHQTFVGQTLALCGAGPSLRDETIRGAQQVWACNSALPYLHARGCKNLSAVGIDQTPGLLREWATPPDVTYYVASSCDPELVRHLRGHGRRVVFFHNAVGLEVPGYASEFDYYVKTWPEPVMMVGEGATVVPRAIGLAQWLGFDRIDIYGADCCLGEDDVAHANGEHVAEAYRNPVIMQGVEYGKTIRTRPDMLMCAVDLVRKVRRSEGRIRLIGDTLPVALLGKSDTYLDQVMRRLTPGEDPLLGDSHGQ